MLTMIWNGSPRQGGDTARLIAELTAHLPGEARRVDAYAPGIAPCVDCRYCASRDGCALRDGMDEVYALIERCDNVVIASPIYFSQLTGPLLSQASRLQTYFCARHLRGLEPIARPKRGGVLLACGGSGGWEAAARTARVLLREMRARDIYPPIVSPHTDRLPAAQDEATLAGARALAAWLGDPARGEA